MPTPIALLLLDVHGARAVLTDGDAAEAVAAYTALEDERDALRDALRRVIEAGSAARDDVQSKIAAEALENPLRARKINRGVEMHRDTT